MSGRPPLCLVALAAVLGIVATTSAARAHSWSTPVEVSLVTVGTPASSVPALNAASVSPSGVALVAIASILAAALVLRRFRHVLVIASVLALLVLTFQSGIHSVHHLGDDRGASECAVASAVTHLAATPVDPPSFDMFDGPAIEEPPVSFASVTAGQPFRPDASRAPPA